MTTSTIVKLSQTALTTTLTTNLYTVPGGKMAIIKEILLANTSTSAVAATVRAGNGTGVPETIIPAVVIPPNSTVLFSLSVVLNAADTITGGAATGAVIGCTISGVTVV